MLFLFTLMLLPILAQDSAAAADLNPLAPWASLTSTGACIGLLIWLITKGFPNMLEKHEKVQAETRGHFERILTNIDTSRTMSARDGHEAARHLSTAIEKNADSVRDNTKAMDSLTQKMVFNRT